MFSALFSSFFLIISYTHTYIWRTNHIVVPTVASWCVYVCVNGAYVLRQPTICVKTRVVCVRTNRCVLGPDDIICCEGVGGGAKTAVNDGVCVCGVLSIVHCCTFCSPSIFLLLFPNLLLIARFPLFVVHLFRFCSSFTVNIFYRSFFNTVHGLIFQCFLYKNVRCSRSFFLKSLSFSMLLTPK